MFPASFRHISLLLLCAVSLSCDQSPPVQQSLEVAVKGLHSAALSPQGKYVVAASIHHGGSLWRISDSERLFNWNHQAEAYSTITAADFDPSGRWAISAEHNTLVLWDSLNGKGERFWTAPGEILDLALGPKAKFAILGLDTHQAVIFDVIHGGIQQTLVHQNRVRSVDLSADGKIAVSGSEDFSVRLWDVRSGQNLRTIKHEDDVQLVRLSADGSLVLSVSKYDKALVWNSTNGEKIGELAMKAENLKRGLRLSAARFSVDNRFLLTGRPDQWVELWSLENFEKIMRWKVPKREKWKPTGAAILDVAFTDNENEYVVAVSNGFVHRLERVSK